MKAPTVSLAAALTRRQFLRRTAVVAAGGAALPQFLPSGVLAANGQPGANDRIGVGFIGIGRQATNDLEILLRLPQAKFVAVADVNLNRAQAAAAKHGAVAMKDFRQLLDRKDVDAVLTATPEHWRGPIVIQSCQAGKDLYVEKPMSLTIREGRLMVEAVRKHQRVLQTGSQQRSMWANVAGCKLIRDGGLGKVTRIIAYNYPTPWHCGLPGEKVPDGLDWEMWCGPNPLVPYNKDLYLPRANPGWLSFRPYSGGEMTGWGAHGFDQVQWALGMDDSGPVEIWTEGPKFDPPTYTASEPKDRGDSICRVPTVFMRYANGAIMELAGTTSSLMGGATFIGERGKVTITRGHCDSDPEDLALEVLSKRPRGFNDNHVKNWLDCIRSREKPIADVEIGHRSATVCHLGNIARWTGRRLKWDPVKEIFPDDAEANLYLDRERRKPWTLPEKV